MLLPLQDELIEMRTADQEMMRRKAFGLGEVEEEVTRRHVDRLREIVANYGWPGKRLVGEDGANAAWIIANRADLATQREFLPLLKQAAEVGDVPALYCAYLEDRIAVQSGEPQIYGTQYQIEEGPVYHTREVLDPVHLEDRRASVGMPPLSADLAVALARECVSSFYGPQILQCSARAVTVDTRLVRVDIDFMGEWRPVYVQWDPATLSCRLDEDDPWGEHRALLN